MQCTLLIPHLWWPHGWGDASREPDLPHLQRLLARSHRCSFPAVGTEAWLCQAFEVERQRDWPVAALTLTVDGADPGGAYWMRADPMHLQPHRDRLLTSPAASLAVTIVEAAALTAALNRHFSSDGLQFFAPHPERWYVRLEADPGIITHAPGEADAGESPWLPTGPDALRWHHVCNEIQMLLHGHPVNQAREARGEPEINSVWLWGGGRHATVPGRHFSRLWSDDVLAQALAASADIPAAAPAADGESWLQALPATSLEHECHLLTFPQVAHAARNGDPETWQKNLAAFDRLWIAPLLAALKRRRLTAIALVAPGSRSCERFDLEFRDLFRFWRTARPLSTYLPGGAQ